VYGLCLGLLGLAAGERAGRLAFSPFPVRKIL
jgi:hypothetical protein